MRGKKNEMERTVKGRIGLVEAAKRLGVSRKTLHNYTTRGLIPNVEILPSGIRRYDPDVIDGLKESFAKRTELLEG